MLAGLVPVAGAGEPVDPSQWPSSPTVEPDLDATPNTVRFAGADRLGTNLALTLALRGNGGYPFDTSDRTSANASGLAAAGNWWGAATCPRSIVITAADTFADSLAAASLSDPLDRSQQPQLTRVAAADPEFDRIGGVDRPDTAYAPVVVTASGRSGAVALSPSARLAAADLAGASCGLAREAIIVGGPAAVPQAVESELVALGYQEVFRVAGVDRYDTAARLAHSLGTQPAPPDGECVDGDVTDGSTTLGFYGNAVPEYRYDATSCRLLSRAVVLADGETGADALAAGWWTSRWQVPVLLTGPGGSLPGPTRNALASLDIDTVIVLGGVARIPESIVEETQRLATATVGRIAGADRTATSIEMAGAFGGWRPTNDGVDADGDVLCVAASSGVGSNAAGWPDALGAGPLCARLAARRTGGPERAIAPLAGAGADAPLAGGRAPSHDAVPVILLPSGDTSVPSSVRALLAGMFRSSDPWCAGDGPTGCLNPGFTVVVGGTEVLRPEVVDRLDMLVSGGGAGARGQGSPELLPGFLSALDLSAAYVEAGPSGGVSLCMESGGVRDARWLAMSDDLARRRFRAEVELPGLGLYAIGSSAPVCVGLPGTGPVVTTPVGIAGHAGPPVVIPDALPEVSLGAALQQPSEVEVTGATWAWRSAGVPSLPVDLRRGGVDRRVQGASLDLDLTVVDGGRGVVEGSWTIDTLDGTLSGVVTGRARRTADGWRVGGQALLDDGGASGGLAATLPERDGPLTWRIDAFDL